MQAAGFTKTRQISRWILVVAILLFTGILLISGGHLQGSRPLLGAGLAVTLVGVIGGIVRLVR